ncbi:hypothetical protein [Pseudonocardia lacus]|uniref:hypothetical protein n=1 Tax=Pseudonocardia lacus TaxID=2835865 RepID=UPI001BDDBAC6|nr:hypothetical protein [Pseudonocardia lacus]
MPEPSAAPPISPLVPAVPWPTHQAVDPVGPDVPDPLDALLAEVVPTRAVGVAADLFRDLARELSVNVAMWSTLLAEHTASADGRFCVHRQCRRGGYGSLATPHPCSVRTLALIACTLHRAAEDRR